MGTMLSYIQTEPELRRRFVQRAFSENPNIKDLSDFKDALFQAFDTERGQRASKFFNDDEILELFNSKECKSNIRENVSEKDFEEIYGEVKRGEVYVERAKPKGVPIKAGQVKIIYTEKKISVKSHTRAGKSIRVYHKSYRKWTKAETRFLQVRKARKLPIKQVLYQYNQHYKGIERSPSSLKTKVYRL